MIYDPKNDQHFKVLKAFHQALVVEGYPTLDTKRFVMYHLPDIMTELQRLKGENKRLIAEVEELRETIEDMGDFSLEESEGSGSSEK